MHAVPQSILKRIALAISCGPVFKVVSNLDHLIITFGWPKDSAAKKYIYKVKTDLQFMYNENARYFQNLTSYFHVPTKQHLYADAVQFIVNVE